MQPHPEAGGFKGRNALRGDCGNDAGQHITGSGGGQTGTAAGIEVMAGTVRDSAAMPFQNQHGMTVAGKGIDCRFEFRTARRRAGVQAPHFPGMRGQQTRPGRPLEPVFGNFSQGVQTIGIQQQGAWKIAPQCQHQIQQYRRASHARTANHDIGTLDQRQEARERRALEAAAVRFRKAMHDQGRIESGDRGRHRLRHRHFHHPSSGTQRGHAGQSRRTGHGTAAANDQHPAEVVFVAIGRPMQQALGNGEQLGRQGMRVLGHTPMVTAFDTGVQSGPIPVIIAATPLPESSMLHLLALGDSYTIGEAVAPEQRWVEQWAGLMQAEGHAMARPVRVIAQTGWTTDELAQAILAAEPLGAWDLATLLIGVNNQYRGRDVDSFSREFNSLLDTAMAAVADRPERVQVLSIPDWGQTPFGATCGRDLNQVSAEIDAYNLAITRRCKARGIALLDITALTRRHSTDPRMHAEDGLHPSADMYGLWAQALLCTGKFGRL